MKLRFIFISAILVTVISPASVSADDDAIDPTHTRLKRLSFDPQFGQERSTNRIIWSAGLPPPGDWRTAGGAHAAYDELTFSPGCGSDGAPYEINGVGFGFIINGSGTQDFDVKLTFFDTHIGDNGSNPPYVPDSELGSVTFQFQDYETGYLYYIENPLDIEPITASNQTVGLRIDCYKLGTSDYHPNIQPAIRGLLNALPDGSSDGRRWVDSNGDGVIASTECNSPSSPRTLFAVVRANSTSSPTPPAAEDLGTLADGETLHDGSVSDSVAYFKFHLAGDATDAARQFLDISMDSRGAEVAIGLYDSNGSPVSNVGLNDGPRSGRRSSLTYGIGIRNWESGLRFDGHCGELPAGDYYLAVAVTASAFGHCFNVAPAAGTADFTIRFDTNTNGAALAAALAPEVRDDIGEVTEPGDNVPTRVIDPYMPIWFQFSICGPASDPSAYLDIDFTGSSTGADLHAYIFDVNGNLVVDRDDNGPGGLYPQYSFGNVGPRDPYSGIQGDPLFTGAEGDLPAGTYYLALLRGRRIVVNNRVALARPLKFGPLFASEVSWYTDITDVIDCTATRGDSNLDGFIDFNDIDCFVAALISEADWTACDLARGPQTGDYVTSNDIDRDTIVNLNDIDGFIECLIQGDCP